MDKKRKVRAIIRDLDKATYDDLVKSEPLKELIIKETPTSIESAVKNRSTFATIFEINNSNTFLEIHKKDWIPALESCIAYYVKKENYEECTRINALINEIRSRNNKMRIKTNYDE